MDYCKYVIDIPFYARQNTFILFNLKAWSELPKDVQQTIEKVTIKFEPQMKAFFEKKIAEEKKKMVEKGLKRIKFSKEDTATYLKDANDAFWSDLQKKIPKEVPILKKLLGY